jgi:hypothetical protein
MKSRVADFAAGRAVEHAEAYCPPPVVGTFVVVVLSRTPSK